MWGLVAIILGTLMGLAGTFVGIGKLAPGHPMHIMMVEMFDSIFGPLQAAPGGFMRVFAGSLITVGSVGMLIGLYVELFGLMDGCIVWVQALMICAPIGLMGLWGYGAFLDMMLGRIPAPAMLTLLWLAILMARLQVTPFGTFPAAQQMLIEAFAGTTLTVMLVFGVLRGALGAPREPLKILAAEFDAKMNGKTASQAADVEQPLKDSK